LLGHRGSGGRRITDTSPRSPTSLIPVSSDNFKEKKKTHLVKRA
jgi:hypothetical protein